MIEWIVFYGWLFYTEILYLLLQDRSNPQIKNTNPVNIQIPTHPHPPTINQLLHQRWSSKKTANTKTMIFWYMRLFVIHCHHYDIDRSIGMARDNSFIYCVLQEAFELGVICAKLCGSSWIYKWLLANRNIAAATSSRYRVLKMYHPYPKLILIFYSAFYP